MLSLRLGSAAAIPSTGNILRAVGQPRPYGEASIPYSPFSLYGYRISEWKGAVTFQYPFCLQVEMSSPCEICLD
jgi:hypothetical protein